MSHRSSNCCARRCCVSATTLVAGPPGVAGPQGAAGAGTQGPQGASGAGIQGPQGALGLSGPQGARGLQGLQGATIGVGRQGSQGGAGPQGSQGVAGIQGAQGGAGPQGSQGAGGAPGSQGITGAQGSQGTAGTQGGAGTQGSQGAAGTQGSQGAAAAAGVIRLAEFYQVGAQDIAAGLPFAFSSALPFNSTGIVSSAGGTVFTLTNAGIYEITFQADTNGQGSMALSQGGTQLEYTLVGRATGTTQIVGNSLLQATAGSYFSVIAAVNNSIDDVVPPQASTVNSAVSTLVIKQLM